MEVKKDCFCQLPVLNAATRQAFLRHEFSYFNTCCTISFQCLASSQSDRLEFLYIDSNWCYMDVFYSAGAESGKAENNGVSPQKRKTESSEEDSSEPKEKKSFSMSINKPVTKTGISMNIGAKKPTQLGAGESKQGISINKKGTSMLKPAPIKMALTAQPKDSSVAVKPRSEKIASVFNDDSEEEEMPPEAKMKMRNVGRETPTAAGPNSYGKNNLGFCDRNKMIEREYKQKLLEMSESEQK